MSYLDRELAPEVRAKALVEAASSRGAIKRLGKWLEEQQDEALWEAVCSIGRTNGATIPQGSERITGKRLLRLARGREQESRRRTNPVRRDESFRCAQCDVAVPAHGRTARNHCPRCLFSLHVDDVPGDRSAGCGGLMAPVALSMSHGHPVILHRCVTCGFERSNHALLDGETPDQWSRIIALSSQEPS